MTHVIEKQARAFEESVMEFDSVMDAHRQAMRWGEFEDRVADLAEAAMGVVKLARGYAERRIAGGTFGDEERLMLVNVCRQLLGSMTHLQDAILATSAATGFKCDGERAHAAAMLETRELMATLLDAAGEPASRCVVLHGKDLAAEGEGHGPDESWYGEDVRGLRGPGR